MESHEAWAPAVERGGKSRRSPAPPPKNHGNEKNEIKLCDLLILMGCLFATFFSLCGPLFDMWGLFCYFVHLMVGLFCDVAAFLLLFSHYRRPFFHVGPFWACPPPHPTKISASVK